MVTAPRWRVRMSDARTAWAVLGIAMIASVALILWMGRETTLFADDVEYFGHLVRTGQPQPEVFDFGARYVFSPFNGHLQAVGKLVYEAWLHTLSPNYFVLRLIEALLWAACVGLFFVLTRTLVGSGVSLAASVLLLFLGAGWEAMLWAFDLHTLIALVCGLGALVVLRRGGRWADPIACMLLVIAVGSIELGLAFVVGVGVGILVRDDRWSRIWIVAVPVVLYLIWIAWARQFGQETIDPLAAVRTVTSIPASLAVTVGSLTGLMDPEAGAAPSKLDSIYAGRLVAVLVAVLFVRRISKGRVSDEAWGFIATLLAFWLFITLGARPADQSRFAFPSALLMLLVGAGLLADKRFSGRQIAVVWLFVALALPTNLIRLAHGRDSLMFDARPTRAEYAMLELAGDQANSDYAPYRDGRVAALSDPPFNGLTAGQYLPAAEQFGEIGYPLAELVRQADRVRLGADASLVGALELKLTRAAEPPAGESCQTLSGSRPDPDELAIGVGQTFVRAPGAESAPIGVTRFSDATQGVQVGRAHSHWSVLEIPTDAESTAYPWTLHTTGQAIVCPAPRSGSSVDE